MWSTRTLVDTDLEELVSAGVVSSRLDLAEHIEPTSMDLPVHGTLYEIEDRFRPQNSRVTVGIHEGGNLIAEHDLERGAILEPGHTYLTQLAELELPEKLRAVASPKSSIGRIDLQVRLLTDFCDFYDRVPYGGRDYDRHKGRPIGIWAEITPRSFRVRLEAGIALNQLRFFDDVPSVVDLRDYPGIISDPVFGMRLFEGMPNAAIMRINVPEEGLVAYEARRTKRVIDLAARDHDPNAFFVRHEGNGTDVFDLEHNKFYLLGTRDRIAIPPHLNAEIEPYTHIFGDLRSHYAGFGDSGFGYDPAHVLPGNIIVLEVRSQEEGNYRLRSGDPIYAIRFFGQTRPPRAAYDVVGSSYRVQEEIKLAKFFGDAA